MKSLSIRRVTRYMALLAKEMDEHGDLPTPVRERPPAYTMPAIPDPWDLEKAEREAAAPAFSIPRTLPPEGSESSGHYHDDEPAQRDDLYNFVWDEENALKDELSPWDVSEEQDAEDTAPPDKFPVTQEQDDFARAMMVLSSDDDFLVTGVGKRPQNPVTGTRMPTPEPIAEPVSAAPSYTDRPADAPPKPPRKDLSGEVMPPGKISLMRVLIAVLIVLLLAAVALGAWYIFTDGGNGGLLPGTLSASVASIVYLGDVNLGCVEDGEALEALLENERLRVEQENRLPAVLGQSLRLEERLVDRRFVAPLGDMEKALLDSCDVLVEASGVYVDGRLVAVVRSELDVDVMMEEALAPYREMQEKRELLDLRFSETVEVKPLNADPQDVMDREELRRILITGEQQALEYYQVESGDSLIAIANRHEIPLSQLRYANPNLIGEDLIRVGDTLSLTPPQGLLTVQFTERVTEEISIPFETVTKTSASLYTTQTEVEKKGVEGLREVVADVTYIAGAFTHRDILTETVIREPEQRVVVKGTKKVTNASGSSTYIWPTQGKISSTYKMRWGKQHQGIDIAAATGTPIYAARDGKVTFSGTNGSYGKLVKIDHGGGVETRYAHCSVLKVSSGTTVKKGQLIALVGNTGNSTGPHLHFEIRVNGEAKDPQGYLPK